MTRPWSATVLLVWSGCTNTAATTFQEDPCRMNEIIERAAGPGAVDCGQAIPRLARPQPVHTCTVAALDGGKRFFSEFVQESTDSEPRQFRVRREDLTVWFYDGDTAGGASSLTKSQCRDPAGATVDNMWQLQCGSLDAPQRVCSNREPVTE